MQRLLERDAVWSQALRLEDGRGILRTAAAVLAHSGDSWFWGAGLLAAAAAGSAEVRLVALRTLAAIGGLAIVVLGVKLLIRRRRPEGEWGAIYRSTDPHSFPSGHAARAFLLAVLAVAWGSAIVAGILIVWAPLVALSRVAMGLHYLSDVVGGALLGLIAGGVALAIVSALG
jgi:undecaprenyl-diphosphatase